MEVIASTLGVAARVNLTVGWAMGDAALGDVRCGAHPWIVGRLLWQWSRRNRGPVDGGSGGCAGLSCWGGERLLEKSA
jgi:hypothetical protein